MRYNSGQEPNTLPIMQAQSGVYNWRSSFFPFIKIKSHINKKKANSANSRSNCGQNFHESEELKTKKKEN